MFFISTIIDSVYFGIKLKKRQLRKYNKWTFYFIYFLIISISFVIVKTTLMGVKAFKISYGSMQPTIFADDYINVDKFAFGIRNPFNNRVWIPVNQPQRGDVVVYIFPQDPSKNYIHRVVALPGEKVQIIDKKLYINGLLIEFPQAVYNDPIAAPARDDSGRWSSLRMPFSSWGTIGIIA